MLNVNSLSRSPSTSDLSAKGADTKRPDTPAELRPNEPATHEHQVAAGLDTTNLPQETSVSDPGSETKAPALDVPASVAQQGAQRMPSALGKYAVAFVPRPEDLARVKAERALLASAKEDGRPYANLRRQNALRIPVGLPRSASDLGSTNDSPESGSLTDSKSSSSASPARALSPSRSQSSGLTYSQSEASMEPGSPTATSGVSSSENIKSTSSRLSKSTSSRLRKVKQFFTLTGKTAETKSTSVAAKPAFNDPNSGTEKSEFRQEVFEMKAHGRSPADVLHHVMTTASRRDDLKVFLVPRCTGENIEFLEDLDAFEAAGGTDRERAKAIFDKYIAPVAENEITPTTGHMTSKATLNLGDNELSDAREAWRKEDLAVFSASLRPLRAKIELMCLPDIGAYMNPDPPKDEGVPKKPWQSPIGDELSLLQHFGLDVAALDVLKKAALETQDVSSAGDPKKSAVQADLEFVVACRAFFDVDRSPMSKASTFINIFKRHFTTKEPPAAVNLGNLDAIRNAVKLKVPDAIKAGSPLYEEMTKAQDEASARVRAFIENHNAAHPELPIRTRAPESKAD